MYLKNFEDNSIVYFPDEDVSPTKYGWEIMQPHYYAAKYWVEITKPGSVQAVDIPRKTLPLASEGTSS